MDLASPFRRKDREKRYFAVVISDRPCDGFQFIPDKDCKIFMATGEADPSVIIPGTVLKSVMDKFGGIAVEGTVKFSEKKA